MTVAWLVVDVLLGLLLAGVVLGAIVAGGAQLGLRLGAWVPWVTAAACIAVAMALGQRIRRRPRL